MHVECLEIPAVKKLLPRRFADVRGYFVETYSQRALADRGIDEAFVKELAKSQPLRVVFRDAGFKDSAIKINVEQIFKLLSPATEVNCI